MKMWTDISGCHRSRRKKIWMTIMAFVPICAHLFSSSFAKHATFADQLLLYDATMPDYETVLSPSDFEMASEINDYPSQNSIDGRSDAWDSDAMYSPDKFEGDIANDINASTVEMFIRGAPSDSNNAQYNAIRDRRQLWPNGRIPYAISSQYSQYSRSVIASAMQEYSKHTCIQWSPRLATDRDYVYIVPDRGCYSLVGRTGGRQTLSLGNGCIQKGIIIHEMMHAVGFFHEQSRTDRDEYITIMWHNILPGMQGQFEKYTSATTQTLGTEYDYGSIMHYGPNAFTRNGMPTIVPKRRSSIGQRTGFSKTDSYKINTLYDCPNYGQSASSGGPSPITQTQYPTVNTMVPNTVTSPSVIVAATKRAPSPSPSNNLLGGVVPLCRNTRPDCDVLVRQGWCQRNVEWMRNNCPQSCGMCPDGASNTIIAVTVSPNRQLPESPTSQPPPSSGVCEDLRVDCAELAKSRYCITAQSFTRTYCARSCGFCFVPPVTEIPDGKYATSTTSPASSGGGENPVLVTRIPMATFWPTLRPVTEPPKSISVRSCRDQKHFCPSWKKSGFCQGIFTNYMKKNCAASCGWCQK